MGKRAAFIDVDGTLLAKTSIFRFLAYDLALRRDPPQAGETGLDTVAQPVAGASRRESNRAFYQRFAGRAVADLVAVGERWFAAECASGGLFNPDVLAQARAHARSGDLVVLVSGSFPPCLAPIGRHIGVDAILCTEPEIADGHYTGWVQEPMIGAAKVAGLRSFGRARGVALRDCFAYGDHASDLDMLNAVGFPVIVGDDEILRRRASRKSWPRIPASPLACQPDPHEENTP